jgi:hypothetical protein
MLSGRQRFTGDSESQRKSFVLLVPFVAGFLSRKSAESYNDILPFP